MKFMHWLMAGAAGGSTGWCFVEGGSDTREGRLVGPGTCCVCGVSWSLNQVVQCVQCTVCAVCNALCT